MPETAQAGKYAFEWHKLRQREFVYWLIFGTYLPGVVGLITLLDWISPGLGHQSGQWIAIAWGGAWVISGYWRLTFRCPRCGERFVADRWWETRSLRSAACIHCDLPLWSDGQDADQ